MTFLIAMDLTIYDEIVKWDGTEDIKDVEITQFFTGQTIDGVQLNGNVFRLSTKQYSDFQEYERILNGVVDNLKNWENKEALSVMEIYTYTTKKKDIVLSFPQSFFRIMKKARTKINISFLSDNKGNKTKDGTILLKFKINEFANSISTKNIEDKIKLACKNDVKVSFKWEKNTYIIGITEKMYKSNSPFGIKARSEKTARLLGELFWEGYLLLEEKLECVEFSVDITENRLSVISIDS
ncbi:MAG: hypothetical protein ACRC6X_07800 [Culicoidibacterales bacterium]